MNWKGVIPAITTPFNADLRVDHGFLAEHARWLVDSGCTGHVPLGSLGEGATAFVPAVEFRSEKQVGRSRSRAFQLSAQRLRRHRHQKSSRMALTMRLATSRARRSIPGPPSSKYAI